MTDMTSVIHLGSLLAFMYLMARLVELNSQASFNRRLWQSSWSQYVMVDTPEAFARRLAKLWQLTFSSRGKGPRSTQVVRIQCHVWMSLYTKFGISLLGYQKGLSTRDQLVVQTVKAVDQPLDWQSLLEKSLGGHVQVIVQTLES